MKCKRLSRILCSFVIHIVDQITLNITYVDFYMHYIFQIGYYFLFLWISWPTYNQWFFLIPYMPSLANWQKWHIFFPIRRYLLKRKQQGYFWTIFIELMNYQMTSYQIEDYNLYLNFGNLSLRFWKWTSSFVLLFISNS